MTRWQGPSYGTAPGRIALSNPPETPMRYPHASETNRRLKHITVVTPCYQEVENVRELYKAIRQVFAELPKYTYIIFILITPRRTGRTTPSGRLRLMTRTSR